MKFNYEKFKERKTREQREQIAKQLDMSPRLLFERGSTKPHPKTEKDKDPNWGKTFSVKRIA